MHLLNQKAITVSWNGSPHTVWVVDNFDGYLDAFADEVGGQLTDERCPFGVLLWPSSRTLADVLVLKPRLAGVSSIVELGCGVGFLSCVLARLYPEAKVVACDYEASLRPFVTKNAEVWGVADRVRFEQIDWRAPPPKALAETVDLVVGADVFYDDSHLAHLPGFASGLLRKGARLVLADPKRFRFSKALDLLSAEFVWDSHDTEICRLDQEGIEEFMIGAGYKDQTISILSLHKA